MNITRVMQLSTGGKAGSMSMVVLSPSGPSRVGNSAADVIITGQVCNAAGDVVGDLYGLCVKAIEAWESELRSLGIVK